MELNLDGLPERLQESLLIVKLEQVAPLHIALLYNPQRGSPHRLSTTEIDAFFDLLKTINNGNLKLPGDFNLVDTDWDTYSSSDDYENYFVSNVVDLTLKQFVNFKTTSSSCLDLVICRDDSNIIAIENLKDVPPFSNHFPISFELNSCTKVMKPAFEAYYSYCICDYGNMNALMTKHPFEPYCYSNVDVTCTLWYEWLHKLIEPNTPIRTRKRQLHPPWITSETSHCLNKLNTLRRKTLRSKVQKPTALNRLEKRCEEMQSADRAEYKDKLFASRDKSKIFKYLKSFQKDPIPPKIEWPEMKVSAVEDFERAELFNKYFTSIVTDNDYKTFEPS